MLSFAIYALQVIICSAIMMLYYGLVLRNKKFHGYNRFYILSVFVLSWLIPLGKIYLFDSAEKPISQILYAVASGNDYLDEVIVYSGFHINWWLVANIAYIIICLAFVTVFVNAILTVYKIQKNNPREFIHHFWLVFTNIAGTPFSFFKYVFWNNAIDINSPTGKQMIQHELVHVNEKHSVDSVLVQVVMCVGWFNPFFWLARKELNVIHEFIADKKSVENGDTAAFAAMLLAAAYPQQHYLLTQSFFFSPIKRRLFMLTQNKNPKFSYMRRLIILPLLAVVVLLFAFRVKHEEKINAAKKQNISASNNFDTLFPNNALFILDGKRISKKDLDSINPKFIKRFDVLNDSSAIAKYGEDGKNGAIEIFSKKIEYNDNEARDTIIFYRNPNAAVVKDGTIATPDGVIVINSKEKEAKSPLFIVDGKPMSKEELNKINGNQIKIINVLKGESAIEKYGEDGKNGVVEFVTKKSFKEKLPADYEDFLNRNKDVSLLNWSNNNSNVTVNLNDGTSETYLLWVAESKKRFINKYGTLPIPPPLPPVTFNKSEDGNVQHNVILNYPVVDTAGLSSSNKNQEHYNKIFTVVQTPPSFPGGINAWQKYLERNLDANVPVKKHAVPGKYTVIVSFIVDKQGNISDVKTENNPGYGTAEEAIRVIKRSPAWVPGVQNGRNVICRHRQAITFAVNNSVN